MNSLWWCLMYVVPPLCPTYACTNLCSNCMLAIETVRKKVYDVLLLKTSSSTTTFHWLIVEVCFLTNKSSIFTGLIAVVLFISCHSLTMIHASLRLRGQVCLYSWNTASLLTCTPSILTVSSCSSVRLGWWDYDGIHCAKYVYAILIHY